MWRRLCRTRTPKEDVSNVITRCDGRQMKPSMWLYLFTVAVMTMLAVIAAAEDDDTNIPSLNMVQRAEALIRTRCSLCHTTDLIYQQRLSEERWKATVDKMMRWGADLSAEEAAALIEYLSLLYPPGSPEVFPSPIWGVNGSR